MARSSRAREVGYLPVYGDGLRPDSVESRFLIGCIDTRRRYRAPAIQPHTSRSPILAGRYRVARCYRLLRAANRQPSTGHRCVPAGPGAP